MEAVAVAFVGGVFSLLITWRRRKLIELSKEIAKLTIAIEACRKAESNHAKEQESWLVDKRHYQDEVSRMERERGLDRETIRTLQGKYIEQDDILKRIQMEREEERRNSGGNQRRQGDKR